MSKSIDWPPEDGKAFIRSDQFGEWLYEAANSSASRFPRLDFSDAYAQVFEWFDSKLKKNRRFINGRRFATSAAFRAYLRRAVKTAALQTLRQRRRNKPVTTLADEFEAAEESLSLDQLLELLEHSRSNLDYREQRVLDWLMESASRGRRESEEIVSSALGMSKEEFERILGKILDDLPLSET